MIWVISDTHIVKSHILPEAFVNRVDREDIIFHLGDMISFEVLEFLRSLCHVEAVHGNSDMPDVRRALSSTNIIELNGLRIGLMHGLGGKHQTMRTVKNEFEGQVDIALFGHTHIAHLSHEDGTMYFNPGSLGHGRYGYDTYGILHLEPEPWAELAHV